MYKSHDIVPLEVVITSAPGLNGWCSCDGKSPKLVTKSIEFLAKLISDWGRKDGCRKILIEGSPGMGKTVLTKKIATLWAQNKSTTTTVAHYIPLGDSCVSKMSSVESFISHFNIVHDTTECKARSRNVTLFLDGFDELPHDMQSNSFIVDLIKGIVLPECSVVILSRPIASSVLHQNIHKTIKIVGFSDASINQYVINFFSCSPNRQQLTFEVAQYFKVYPNIKRLCRVPINLCILLNLITEMGTSKAKSLTEMYKNFVNLCISKQVKRNLDQFSYEKILHSISQLAFKSFQRNQFAFSLNEVAKHCFVSAAAFQEFDCDNLFKTVKTSCECENPRLNVKFAHSTIQEYLAALHFSRLPQNQQFSFLKSNSGNARYQYIWVMYAGMSRTNLDTLLSCIAEQKYDDHMSTDVTMHCRANVLALCLKLETVTELSTHAHSLVVDVTSSVLDSLKLNLRKQKCEMGKTCTLCLLASHLTNSVLDELAFSDSKNSLLHSKSTIANYLSKKLDLLEFSKPRLISFPDSAVDMANAVSDPGIGSIQSVDKLQYRVESFTKQPVWKGCIPHEQMAEAGFVYTGQEDLVYCFSCGLKLDEWTVQMDPLVRHKEERPSCPFVKEQLEAIRAGKSKTKSVVLHSKPLTTRMTSSIGQLRSSTLQPAHAVVVGLNEQPKSLTFVNKSLVPKSLETKDYSTEMDRLRSYDGWPLNETVHPEQLARAGFVYSGEGSLVQCFTCGVKYRHWYRNDDPMKVHKLCNPRCPFLMSIESSSALAGQQTQSLPTPLQLTRPTKPLITSISRNQDGNVQEDLNLKFPDYSKESIRMESFKHWNGVLPPKELAEAGFYMMSRPDIVKCFSCRVVLQDWERSDDVIGEHLTHSPNCIFVKNFTKSNNLPTKTDDELLSAQLSSMEVLSNTKPEGNAASSINANMPSASNSLTGDTSNNYPLMSVATANILQPSSYGELQLPHATSLSRQLNTVTEDQEMCPPKNIFYPPSWNLKSYEYEESLSETMEQNLPVKGRSSDSTPGTPAAGHGFGICQICYDKKIDCIFLPCGHARTCEDCARRIKNSGQPCPYCREAVSTTHRIFL